MYRIVWIVSLGSLLGMHGIVGAQAPSGEHKAACKIDNRPASDADLAFFRGDAKKAQTLYAAAVAANPLDGASHEREIDSMLGEHKFDEANKELDAWVALRPKDPYAMAAAADIHFAEGDLLGSYALNQKALQTDPCNADAYADSAHFEWLAGYHAAARRHYAIAHQLEPNNEDFRRDWINTLEGAQYFAEMKKFIAESKALDEAQRSAAAKDVNLAQARVENRCELVSVTGPAILPMTPIYSHGTEPVSWGLEIAFNGHKRVLQIDTGASGFLLSRLDGGSLGLPGAVKTRVGGFGDQGANDVDLERADSVHVGGLEFHQCTVGVLANYGVMGGSHLEGRRIDTNVGLVGTDIFSRYLVTLDYVKHEIRLEPLPQDSSKAPGTEKLDPLGGSEENGELGDRMIAPSMKSWTSIYRRGHELMVPTSINGKAAGLFIVDTGNVTNMIDLDRAKQFTSTKDGIYQIRGLSGKADMSEAGAFTVDFAGLRLPVRSMDSIDLSRFRDGVIGFLGYPTLRQLVMHIDYRDNLVLFEAPNGKKR